MKVRASKIVFPEIFPSTEELKMFIKNREFYYEGESGEILNTDAALGGLCYALHHKKTGVEIWFYARDFEIIEENED